MSRPDLLGLSRARLRERLDPYLDRPFRVEQVYRAVHHRGITDLATLTELGRALREQLAEHFVVGRPRLREVRRSEDGTEKLLFELADGTTVETVDIPEGRRRTLCLSSQAGCALACRFCVTGYWGAGRDLSAGEIVGQVFAARERRPEESERWPNLVFMGMGEPLLNLGAVREALEILCEQLSWRRVTVSTAGIVDGIEELARWPRRPNLALSLHAPDEERRSRLMPVNRTHPLRDLLRVLRRFPLERGRRLTFEYLLIDGFNDSVRDAVAVGRRLEGIRAKVNLIPMNPDPVLDPALQPPGPERVEAFRRRLERSGVPATVRRRRGDDASAACGQLRAVGRDPRGFRGRSAAFDQEGGRQTSERLRPAPSPSRR